MGFNSVYRSLTEIFPQIDARLLRAVAIEHPKDADVAAAIVLSEIVPSLPSNISHNVNQFWKGKSSSTSVSDREVSVERDSEDVVSRRGGFLVASGSKSSVPSCLETIPLVVGRGHGTIAPSTKLVFNRNELSNLPLKVGRGKCFDVTDKEKFGLDVPDDDLASALSTVSQEEFKSTNDFWQDIDFHMTLNQAESSTRTGNAVQKLVDISPEDNIQQDLCFEAETRSRKEDTSKGSLASENGDPETKRSLASENGDTELDGAFSSSTHGCSVDHLEEIIEDAKSNKKTLLTVMESVVNLMKQVELEEKDAEKSELEAARGGLDTLEKVEELKKMLEHAKEANDMHAGEVYGEKSILATEVKELENRLLNLSEERCKSLAVLDEMRETLVIRAAVVLERKWAAEQEKNEKEVSALKALAEQEAIMAKVVQESQLLQKEAEENSKLREFLMDRGQVVDSLLGEISVICQDVKLLKEKFDNGVSLTKSISSSQTSSCGSSVRSLVLESPSEILNGVTETSSNNKSPEEEEEATSSMNKEKDDCRELIEDGWDIFDKEIEL